jgi:hypothetical protein
VAASLVGGALVGLALIWQASGWAVEQVLLQLDLPAQWWIWPVTVPFALALMVAPAVLIWRIPRSVAVRECGRAWFWGAIAALLGAVLRAIPDAYAESYLACLAVTFTVVAFLARRPAAERAQRPPAAMPLAVLGGVAMLVPWLALGALGGLLETALAVPAAAAAGGLVASVLDGRFWAAFAVAGRVRLVVVGGLVAGVALLLVAAGLGESGTQLTAMLALPPLGFAAAVLAVGSPTAAGWLVGIAALGPLAFADSEELSLFLIGRDIPFWIGIAALCSVALALLFGLGYGLTLLKRRIPPQAIPAGRALSHSLRPEGGLIAAALAVAMVIGAGAVYAFAGQPGLHGEKLFVVMKDQAPLTGLPTTFGPAGRGQRVGAVYQRLTSFAEASQKDLRKQLDRWKVQYRAYYLVNGILVDGGPVVRNWLAKRPDVDRVLLDPVLRPLPVPNPVDHGSLARPPQGIGWNIEMVGAPQAWARGITGQGIVIGSSDSGVDGTHPVLQQGFRGGDDSWYDPWYGSTAPRDYNGHGTHTTATAVGRGGIGVAPDAQWVGCVNLARNLGSPSHYLDCLQFMLAPFPYGGNPFTDGRPARAPHILTNSWGCPVIEGCDSGSLSQATAALAAAGIAVVVAAGNSGPRCDSIIDPPAIYPSVITVAAVNEKREVAVFSSRGPGPAGKPVIAAPGERIVSAMPGGRYGAQDGTSMATPHVAGLIALLWSQRPELIGDLATTRALLSSAARPAANVSADCGGVELQVGAGIAHAVISG